MILTASSHRTVFTVATIWLALFLLSFHSGHILGQRVEGVLSVYAKLYPTTMFGVPLNIQGYVTMSQISLIDPRVNVTVNVTGNLTPGQSYGLHIDNYGDLSDQATGQMGGSTYQGSGSTTPGCPLNLNTPRREGDLGNWTANANGKILGSLIVPLGNASIELLGDYSVVGRSVALHSQPDNCATENTSPILAQGVLGIMNIDNNFAEFEATCLIGVAILFPTSLCPGCAGTVWLTQGSAPGVTVTARVTGLTHTAHELNIHQFGDLSTGDETAMGAHYNPNGRPHNLPPAMPRHMGDLGNIQTYDSSGVGWYQLTSPNIPDIHEVLGRSVVIDSLPDHGIGAGCDQDGNAGAGLLVGIIGVANPSNTPQAIPSGLVLNNTFTSIDCSASTAHPGLTAALVIGWVLTGILIVVVVAMLAYYFLRLKNRQGYQEMA